MTATASPSRKEQAVQLRLAGLSRSQIADALGLAGGGEPLSRWLRDVPPPAWTRRPRAKDDLREIAVAMRQEGRSYREIREVVGVAKSTLSLWLRDIPLTDEQRVALALRCPPAASRRARAIRASAAQRRQRVEREAREQISRLSESELFVAGVVAYWAEGTKNKPWRTGERLAFLNSDPAMIRLFLSWLRLLGVGSERLQYRVNIHESADVGGAEQFWAAVVGGTAGGIRPNDPEEAQPEDRPAEHRGGLPRLPLRLGTAQRRPEPPDRRLVRRHLGSDRYRDRRIGSGVTAALGPLKA